MTTHTAKAQAYIDCKNGKFDVEVAYRERSDSLGRLLMIPKGWTEHDRGVIDRRMAADLPLDGWHPAVTDGLLTTVETKEMTPAEVATALRRVMDDIDMMRAEVDYDNCNVGQVIDQLRKAGLWAD